jgi:hypothetical protein
MSPIGRKFAQSGHPAAKVVCKRRRIMNRLKYYRSRYVVHMCVLRQVNDLPGKNIQCTNLSALDGSKLGINRPMIWARHDSTKSFFLLKKKVENCLHCFYQLKKTRNFADLIFHLIFTRYQIEKVIFDIKKRNKNMLLKFGLAENGVCSDFPFFLLSHMKSLSCCSTYMCRNNGYYAKTQTKAEDKKNKKKKFSRFGIFFYFACWNKADNF